MSEARNTSCSAGSGDEPAGIPNRAFGEERRGIIVGMAHQQRVGVAPLAELFTVSTETIRRDLAVLESRGLIVRVHGGAIASDRNSVEPPIDARATTMAAEKVRIAKAALGELPASGSIFIEAGSTPSHLADMIPAKLELTVVTNGSYLATSLARMANLTVIAVGGRVRQRTLACVDDWALRTLGSLFVDVAFLGTNGISVSRGLTTPDPAEAAVKRATLSVSDRRVLLADHTKVGAVSLCRYGDVDDVDVLITDTGLSDEAADGLEMAGLRVIRT